MVAKGSPPLGATSGTAVSSAARSLARGASLCSPARVLTSSSPMIPMTPRMTTPHPACKRRCDIVGSFLPAYGWV